MRVFRKFQASDGRIKVATLSGVSALVAVIAMLVGVLPVFASHSESKVEPVVVDLGGGSGHCSSTTDDGRLPSIAGNEFHINNPTVDQHTNGIITVDVYDLPEGRVFDFFLNDGIEDIVVYDVVVNGGPKSNHYDYDDHDGADGSPPPGTVEAADKLHAPEKGNKLHNLSHINLCYDVPGLTSFVCDADAVKLTEEEEFLTVAEASIFANSEVGCTDKRGSFLIEDDTVTLDFGTDDGGVVAGRLDITKDFTQDDTPDKATDFENLEYDGPGEFVELQWCEIRTPKATDDGDEFDVDDVLASDEYPSLDGVEDTITDELDNTVTVQATACKVAEIENAAGVQHTVVYFEFEDPRFR